MEPKQAIEIARDYIRKVYSDEPISNIGLEEVEYLPRDAIWKIGLSFSREKEIVRTRAQLLADLAARVPPANPSSPPTSNRKMVMEQLYKTVSLSENGDVLSMKNMTSSEPAA